METCDTVLILVLLGCGLLGHIEEDKKQAQEVLILVLLGCGLLVSKIVDELLLMPGLNPCFVGMWSFS